MKKSILILSLSLGLIAQPGGMRVLAQASPGGDAADGGRKELKQVAGSQEIQEELESPDGVALQLLPEGGFRIYGRGSATYDFNESDEIRVATRNATLRAKAAIGKFLRERVRSTDGMSNIETKIKKLSGNGTDPAKIEVSKKVTETTVEEISSHADEVMSGLVTISTSKKPVGNGGDIQVTVGWSSKTRATAEAIRARRPLPGSAGAQGKGVGTGVGTLNDSNNPEIKKSKTDF